MQDPTGQTVIYILGFAAAGAPVVMGGVFLVARHIVWRHANAYRANAYRSAAAEHQAAEHQAAVDRLIATSRAVHR